jgi:hypothetical protein
MSSALCQEQHCTGQGVRCGAGLPSDQRFTLSTCAQLKHAV